MLPIKSGDKPDEPEIMRRYLWPKNYFIRTEACDRQVGCQRRPALVSRSQLHLDRVTNETKAAHTCGLQG